jgi:alanine racemase
VRTHVRVDLARLVSNYRSILGACAGVEIMAVVKADAYGHGAVQVARTLARAGCKHFGVATLEEGLELRQSGVAGEIVLLSGLLPGEADAAAQADLTPAIHNSELLGLWRECASRRCTKLPCHLHVDSGMNRLGFTPASLAETIAAGRAFDALDLRGLSTHLASAEDFDDPATEQQLARFADAARALAAAGIQPPLIHFANTAGAAYRPLAGSTMIRAGLGLYGYVPERSGQGPAARFDVAPALEWRAAVLAVRDVAAGERLGYNGIFKAASPLRVATLGAGYGDGLRRDLSDKGAALLDGVRCRIVGRVSMDLTLIDVSAHPNVELGDDAVLLSAELDAAELAACCRTIPYEILCGISTRVARLYR